MKIIREICVAGNCIDVSVRVPSGHHNSKRSPKRYITAEKVQQNNDRMAVKKLTRLMNANFSSEGYHFTLTYENEPDLKEAKKELDRFIKRMGYQMKKEGKEFKWIVATESKGHRIHHHFISNASKELAEAKWKAGLVFAQPLNNNPNRNKLANYIIKESQNTFREEETPFRTRYSHSRNLKVPEVKVEQVNESYLWDDPQPFKGYYIDKDTVRRYEHPITGLDYLEYMMISETAKPARKSYNRGKVKRREENYSKYINYEEEQQVLPF